MEGATGACHNRTKRPKGPQRHKGQGLYVLLVVVVLLIFSNQSQPTLF